MKKDDESIINNKNKNQIKKLLSHLSEKCGTPINITTMFNLYDLFESMVGLKYF